MNDQEAQRPSSIALYRTDGPRRKKHVAVLYLGADRDWSSIQLSRNGNASFRRLASAPETEGVREYREQFHRAMSLQYSGTAPADLDGLKGDLEAFGYDQETVARFVEAAKPHFEKL